MKIEKNTTGYNGAPGGLGYIIHHAPAIGDISAGAVWLFTCSLSDSDGEDTLQLLDLSENQAMSFPSDADYDRFLEERSICFSFDWSQTGAKTPHRLFERARLMIETVRDTYEEMTARAHAWHFIERSGGLASIVWGTRSEAEAYADHCDEQERERGNDVDLHTVNRLTAKDIEKIGRNLFGGECLDLGGERRHVAG